MKVSYKSYGERQQEDIELYETFDELFLNDKPLLFKFPWEETDERFKDGNPERFSGHWISYYPDGKKQADGFYQNGRRDGLFQLWNEAGFLFGEIPYLDGRLNGTLKFWDAETKEQILHCEFTNHKKNGTFRAKNEHFLGGEERTALVWEEGTYDMNQKAGLWTKTFLDGKPAVREFYQQDKFVGERKTWYRNGQLEHETQYDSEGNIKLSRYWHPNGQLKSERKKEGYEKTLTYEWYDDGTVSREYYVWFGRSDLPDRHFYRNGKLSKEKVEAEEKGAVIHRTFYESGQLKVEYTEKHDRNFGTKRKYYESGQLKAEYTKHGDKVIGVKREYYENGQLKEETPYDEAGRIDGEHKKFDETGKLIYVQRYLMGDKD